MDSSFAGKVVLVVGGTGGLGRAVSVAFLEEAANVIVTYRKQDEFDALKNAAAANASRLQGYVVDATDEAAVGRLIDTIIEKSSRLDAMVNAVGGFAGGKTLWETETKAFDQMLALNLRSGYALSRAAVKIMLKQRAGSIVNVASKASLAHEAGVSAYTASKAAALALMDCLAAEVHGTGVRVNSILPSIMDTEPNRRAMPTADFASWPKVEEIARVILFLCSEQASVIHGAAIPVYGNR